MDGIFHKLCFVVKRETNERRLLSIYSFIYLFIIHLFIFNAGPMLIAVFITEMVILHKYVYLLLLSCLVGLVLRPCVSSSVGEDVNQT